MATLPNYRTTDGAMSGGHRRKENIRNKNEEKNKNETIIWQIMPFEWHHYAFEIEYKNIISVSIKITISYMTVWWLGERDMWRWEVGVEGCVHFDRSTGPHIAPPDEWGGGGGDDGKPDGRSQPLSSNATIDKNQFEDVSHRICGCHFQRYLLSSYFLFSPHSFCWITTTTTMP